MSINHSNRLTGFFTVDDFFKEQLWNTSSKAKSSVAKLLPVSNSLEPLVSSHSSFHPPLCWFRCSIKIPIQIRSAPSLFSHVVPFSQFLAFHLLGNPHPQHFCWKKMATDETRELWFHTVCFKLISSFPLWLSSPWMLSQCAWNHPFNSFFWLLYSRSVGYPSLSLHSFAELLKL